MAILILLSLLSAPRAQKGCTAVARDQCATDFDHSCLRCGSASSFDCEECCPGCKQVVKGEYKFCECGKPPPGPTPDPPGGDAWDHYRVAGMDVVSVTGGDDKSDYEKVVVMLHGGGGSGSNYEYNYRMGWFGNLSGIKYVFPTSAISSHVWFITYKNGCGLNNDCAYNVSSIHESASRVAALIDHEKQAVGGDSSKVFLAGFSEGAQLTGYVQLCQLDYALGGTIIMDGFPLPPLFDMPGHAPKDAQKNATYYGEDMRWMIWHGEADPIFPANFTLTTWNGILDVLGVRSTLKIEHIEPGMAHTLIKPEFARMVDFIRG